MWCSLILISNLEDAVHLHATMLAISFEYLAPFCRIILTMRFIRWTISDEKYVYQFHDF